MQRNTAQTPTQQRNRDRDERIVVPDGGRVDARETDLENKSGKRDQQNRSMDRHRRSPEEQAVHEASRIKR